MNNDHIFIERLTFDCIVGVLPHERITPQPLIIDIVLETDIRSAAQSTALTDTIDYGAVAKTICRFVSDQQFLLLESLAEDTTKLLLEDTRIRAVDFTVRKPNAIDNAAAAGVRIYRSR